MFTSIIYYYSLSLTNYFVVSLSLTNYFVVSLSLTNYFVVSLSLTNYFVVFLKTISFLQNLLGHPHLFLCRPHQHGSILEIGYINIWNRRQLGNTVTLGSL